MKVAGQMKLKPEKWERQITFRILQQVKGILYFIFYIFYLFLFYFLFFIFYISILFSPTGIHFLGLRCKLSKLFIQLQN